MAISLTGAGSFPVRAGHLMAGMLDLLALVGGTATSRVLSGANLASRTIATVTPDYSNGTPLPQVIQNLQSALTSIQGSSSSLLSTYQTIIQNTLQAMASVDTQGANADGSLSQLLSGMSANQAMQILYNQMVLNSDTVQAPTVSSGALTNVGTPNGNPTVVVGLKTAKGAGLALVFPETLSLVCSADSQSGGRAVGNELMSVTGQAAVSNPLSYLYPGGSGVSTSLAAITAGTSPTTNNNSNGNLAYNGSFLTYSNANVPDQFAIKTGTAGVTVLNGSGTTYLTGAGSVELVGDSSTLATITQSFSTAASTTLGAGGTPAVLTPDQIIHVCIFFKLSAGSPVAGVLKIALTDGSGTTVNDDSGNANSVTQALTSIGDTSWHAVTAVFRTPAVLPTTTPPFKLQIGLSTALTTGTNIYMSNLTVASPTGSSGQFLYPGGPTLTIHAGSSKLINGLSPDTFSLALSNNYQTSGDGLFQAMLDRIFNLRSLGIQLPTAPSSPTINDSVIT